MCSGHAYLLIVMCSQRKRSDPALLPALERYDGIFFRILRKAWREGNWPTNLDVLILSTKYGLIELDTAVENYDLRMTVAQAKQLKPMLVPLLTERVEALSYMEIFLNVSQIYRGAIEGWNMKLSRDPTIIYAGSVLG